MTKIYIMIFANVAMLISSFMEVQQEFVEGFHGIKAHHGVLIFAICGVLVKLDEAHEYRESLKEKREKLKEKAA